jgi:transposase
MLNRKESAALAGLAPFNRDSGTLRGSRCIWGAAPRSGAGDGGGNPQQSSHQKLLSAVACHKHAKRAPTAYMRKLLVILNAMLRNKTHCKIPRSLIRSQLFLPSRARI